MEEKAIEKTSSADRFIGTMAEKLGAVAKAATVFGEPVERDGITVIPVAKARWGFGGGAGQRKDEDGAGGGGGVQSNASGFHRNQEPRSKFPPDPNCIAALDNCGKYLELVSATPNTEASIAI